MPAVLPTPRQAPAFARGRACGIADGPRCAVAGHSQFQPPGQTLGEALHQPLGRVCPALPAALALGFVLALAPAVRGQTQGLADAPATPPRAVAVGPGTGGQAGPVLLPVVTLDQQALFARSAFGRRALERLDAAREELIGESEALAQELIEAERALTEARAALGPEEFRALAEAFDARTQEIRTRQDAKDMALLRDLNAEQQRFFALATPALADLAREIGAVAILSPQAVLLTVGPIDITDIAVARLDAVLGSGAPAGDAPRPAAPATRAPDGTPAGD